MAHLHRIAPCVQTHLPIFSSRFLRLLYVFKENCFYKTVLLTAYPIIKPYISPFIFFFSPSLPQQFYCMSENNPRWGVNRVFEIIAEFKNNFDKSLINKNLTIYITRKYVSNINSIIIKEMSLERSNKTPSRFVHAVRFIRPCIRARVVPPRNSTNQSSLGED